MSTASKISFALAVALSCVPAVFGLTVTATPAPGTYKESVFVALTPDVPGAKILYGFDPEGNLENFKTYSSEVALSSTTPFVWYGFLDEKTESPFSIEKYVFDFSKTFALAGARAQGGKIVGVGVRNSWSGSLSAAGWTVRSGNAASPLPARPFAANEAAKLPDLAYSGGSLELVAPDGSVQASMSSAQLASGVAFAPPSVLVASLLDAGSSPVAWVVFVLAALGIVGLARSLLRVRKAHGGWHRAWRAVRKALGLRPGCISSHTYETPRPSVTGRDYGVMGEGLAPLEGVARDADFGQDASDLRRIHGNWEQDRRGSRQGPGSRS